MVEKKNTAVRAGGGGGDGDKRVASRGGHAGLPVTDRKRKKYPASVVVA